MATCAERLVTSTCTTAVYHGDCALAGLVIFRVKAQVQVLEISRSCISCVAWRPQDVGN